MKIVTVIGARPQFIKCAPLSREIRKSHKEIIIHTGQHYDYDMDKIFFEQLEIPNPDYNLGVGSGTHGYQTGIALVNIEKILLEEKPDLVIVYGDTNSTLAGAIASAKLNLKVAHVEAGMRSDDMTMPEELNRILVDHCSTLLMCSGQISAINLNREGINSGIYITGDIMVDVLEEHKQLADKSEILEQLDVKSEEYIVMTIHRQVNTDVESNLRNIVKACQLIDKTIVFPIHPRTRKYLESYCLYDELNSAVKLINPLGYLDFLKLQSNASKILTDSGGIQKEAYILGVPCITLRNTTEWVETVRSGWNILVGVDIDKIVKSVYEFNPIGIRDALYGSHVAINILKVIESNC